MSTTFLEPGGDSTGNVAITSAGGFWQTISGATSPTVATDVVHGTHANSISYVSGSNNTVTSPNGVVSDTGSRVSFYFNMLALPTATATILVLRTSGGTTALGSIRIDPSGIFQLWNQNLAQMGGNGPTLSMGVWYRISLAYTIASTTVNRFEAFVNGVSAVSVTNFNSLNGTGTSCFRIGNNGSDSTLNFRSSDHYSDNSSSLTDPGNIWVAAKRPFSNGTTNDFTTQIGAGGSGYGTGHAPQVNEVPLSTTNGWSMIGTGSAVTEEYTIEGQSVGFVSTAGGTIVDFEGWVDASSVTSETASIIVAGATSNISLTSSATLFTKIAGSTTYPVGGTDIGIVTGTTVTTVGLYECGILVAFIPAQVSTTNLLSALGAG